MEMDRKLAFSYSLTKIIYNLWAIKMLVCVDLLLSCCLFLVVNGATAAQQEHRVAAGNTFVFTPNALRWAAIDASGRVIRTGRASGGRNYCPDLRRRCKTPIGTFHVISMGGAGCASSRYPVGHGGAKMPYCMFFTKLYAIHGSYEVPNYNASHGCIRVIPSDALWLRNNFIRIGTRVVVRPY